MIEPSTTMEVQKNGDLVTRSNRILTTIFTAVIKSIIHKSRGEVSLVEQDTIDYISTDYFEPKRNYGLFCF